MTTPRFTDLLDDYLDAKRELDEAEERAGGKFYLAMDPLYERKRLAALRLNNFFAALLQAARS